MWSHIFVQDKDMWSVLTLVKSCSSQTGPSYLGALIFGYFCLATQPDRRCVPSQSLVTAEVKRWMSIPTSRDRTGGSRASKSNLLTLPKSRKVKLHLLWSCFRKSRGCHSYLCTTWYILCVLGFIYSRKSQSIIFHERNQAEKGQLLDPDHTEVSTRSELSCPPLSRSNHP